MRNVDRRLHNSDLRNWLKLDTLPRPSYKGTMTPTMHRLARVTLNGKEYMDVFHEEHSGFVCFQHRRPKDSEWIHPQYNIVRSISHDLCISPSKIVANQIMVFDQKERHGKAYDTDIYECTWSDFACDKLVLHVNITALICV